jgi:hypothetical protein
MLQSPPEASSYDEMQCEEISHSPPTAIVSTMSLTLD